MSGITINWPGKPAETLPVPDDFQNGEWRTIKRITGLRPSEMMEAFQTGDPDAFVAYAIVALRRAHPLLDDREIQSSLDALAGGSIVIDWGEPEEAGASPLDGADAAPNDAGSGTQPS